jgi:DUF1680 family protein
MVQRTNYPWDGAVAITVNPQGGPKRMTLRVRVPDRETSALYDSTPKVRGLTSLAVNGRAVKQTVENGYAVITRTWAPGDRVDLEIPLPIQRVRAVEQIEADRGKVALRRGPIVFNIEKVDVGDIEKAIAADAPLAAQWRAELLHGVMTLQGRFADGSPLVAIPNYARMNREPAPPPAPPTPPGERPPPPPIASVVWINEVRAS